MLENITKGVIVVRDDVLAECLKFVEMCETHGRDIKAEVDAPMNPLKAKEGRRTVGGEARLLKALLLKLLD